MTSSHSKPVPIRQTSLLANQLIASGVFAHMADSKNSLSQRTIQRNLLRKSETEQTSLMGVQYVLEETFNKNQLKDRVRSEFEDPFIYEMAKEAEVPPSFAVALCAEMSLRKRATPGTLIGLLHHFFETAKIKQPATFKLCAEALERSAHSDLMDYSERDAVFICRYELTEDVERELELYQFPLPLVVPPRICRNNHDNGYHSEQSSAQGASKLLMLQSSPEHWDIDICLDHINRVNQIPLQINAEVVSTIDNEWADLDRQRPSETREEYIKRVKAFEKYDRSSRDIMATLLSITSDTETQTPIWLTHKYDRRGRIYCQGYHVTYQGTEWNKSAIQFFEKETLNES